MTDEISYRDYVSDEAHMEAYAAYQARYSGTIRESDGILIDMLRQLARPAVEAGERPSLLDVGCSTGNLLLHLSQLVPELELHGGDIVGSIIARNRQDPPLGGVEFHELDMLEPRLDRQFDIVVTNAALMFFTEEEFALALRSLGALTRPGGWFVSFDFFHTFEQEVAITERSSAFPEGLRFFFRSYRGVRESLGKAGFADPEFRPFSMPIDLERPGDPADISSHTVRTAAGEGLSFRGTVFQPWCHLVARRQT